LVISFSVFFTYICTLNNVTLLYVLGIPRFIGIKHFIGFTRTIAKEHQWVYKSYIFRNCMFVKSGG